MNLAFEWRRKQKRTIVPQRLANDPIAQDMSPADALEQKEQYARVLRALEGMSELSRQVIVLHRLQDETYDAVALQLDKTPHQVRAICSKAIGQLRDLLGSSTSSCSEE